MSTFVLSGPWTIEELLRASAEVWRDLADVEDDEGIAAGFRAMACDLTRYADTLGKTSKQGGADVGC